MKPQLIDTALDSRTDAEGKDPDIASPTLREYHRLLWSKALPGGEVFDLNTSRPRAYLHHKSDLGEFFLSSDTVVPTFRSYRRMATIIDQIPTAELDEFQLLNHTIGGALVFPGERREGTQTINQARGRNGQIADRLDLTLEAIRLHYAGEPNILSKSLTAYDDFFRLFATFKGYVDFFLLQDAVSANYGSVEFFLPADEPAMRALPTDVKMWRFYRDRATAFVKARNRRIDNWARVNLGDA